MSAPKTLYLAYFTLQTNQIMHLASNFTIRSHCKVILLKWMVMLVIHYFINPTLYFMQNPSQQNSLKSTVHFKYVFLSCYDRAQVFAPKTSQTRGQLLKSALWHRGRSSCFLPDRCERLNCTRLPTGSVARICPKYLTSIKRQLKS